MVDVDVWAERNAVFLIDSSCRVPSLEGKKAIVKACAMLMNEHRWRTLHDGADHEPKMLYAL